MQSLNDSLSNKKLLGPDNILVPDSYSQLDQTRFQKFTKIMNAAGSIWIILLMILVNLDIFGRNLFNTPVRGVTELLSLSIVGIVFLQLPDAVNSGKLARAEVLLGYLQRIKPQRARFLQCLYHLAGAILLAIIAYTSIGSFVESVQTGEYLGAIGDFQARLWPIRFIIVLGSACTMLIFILLSLNDFNEARRKI